MKKPFCNKYKLFYSRKIFSEFQINSTVGEMKSITHPFHPTGWNCTCSPHPILSHPISIHFPSLSLFQPWLFEFYAPGASCNSKNSNRNHNHDSHNPKQPSWDILNLFQLQKTMAKPPLIAMGAGFSSVWTIKYFFFPCYALGIILCKLLTKKYPFENPRHVVGKLFLNLF